MYALGARAWSNYDAPTRAADRARRLWRGLSLVVYHSRHRQQHPVPDAEGQTHESSPQKAIPRRTVLRGIGASRSRCRSSTAWRPAFAAIRNTAAHPVRRFGVVYVPNGMAMKHFTPAAEGLGFETTRILKPIEAFKDQMHVLTGP